jgi:glycosyltransferase involved in cell wall biosynthesis
MSRRWSRQTELGTSRIRGITVLPGHGLPHGNRYLCVAGLCCRLIPRCDPTADYAEMTNDSKRLGTDGAQVDLVLVTTSDLTLWAFFQTQISFLTNHGLNVQTISSPGTQLHECRTRMGITMHEVPMKRAMSPFADARALVRLWRLFRKIRPSIVHTHTPKAGLLATAAAFFARVPVRIYTFNGLLLLARSGWRRAILWLAEYVACRFATEALCVSLSLREVVVHAGLCPAEKIKTLGYGASHGVDLTRFNRQACRADSRDCVRRRYDIPPAATVVGFVGRLVNDKGIKELSEAWPELTVAFPDAHLLLCGAFEPHDPVPLDVVNRLRADPRVHITDRFEADMVSIYTALDICVLPTYREGLPNVALESAALEIPIVATRVPGCVDAVIDGVTGILVEPKNARALATALRLLIANPELRLRLGRAARAFVAERFSESAVSETLLQEYQRMQTLHHLRFFNYARIDHTI